MEPRNSIGVTDVTSSKGVSSWSGMRKRLKQIGLRFDPSAYGTAIVLILGIIITSILSPAFLTVSNISNLLSQISALGIVTMGQTIALFSGGIDMSNSLNLLSVGANYQNIALGIIVLIAVIVQKTK